MKKTRHPNDLELAMKIPGRVDKPVRPPFSNARNRINDQKSSRDPTGFISYNCWNARNDNRCSLRNCTPNAQRAREIAHFPCNDRDRPIAPCDPPYYLTRHNCDSRSSGQRNYCIRCKLEELQRIST